MQLKARIATPSILLGVATEGCVD
jgi:hypothetical protein